MAYPGTSAWADDDVWPAGMNASEVMAVRRRGYLGAVLVTMAWCAVPVTLYLLWALLLDGTARPGCLDAAGDPCLSPRAEALRGFVETLPALSVTVAASVLTALPLRRAASEWHALTIGFTAAALGAGISTALLATLGG